MSPPVGVRRGRAVHASEAAQERHFSAIPPRAGAFLPWRRREAAFPGSSRADFGRGPAERV